MVEIPRSSFIPRESPGMMPARVRRKKSFAVFDVLATVLLIGSLALAGVAYALKSSAAAKNDRLNAQINDAGGPFNQSGIEEIRGFSMRLKAAETLLKNHVSPLKVFSALEASTKSRVQYLDFTFEHEPGFDAFVSLGGGTEEFKTIALQSIEYDNASVFKNIIVSDVQSSGGGQTPKEGETGVPHSVSFSVAGNIPQELIAYDGTEFLRGGGNATVPEATPGTAVQNGTRAETNFGGNQSTQR